MKRRFKLLLVLCTMFLLAGCSLKQDYNIDITSDKKISIGYTVGMDNQLIDMFLTQSSDSEGESEFTDEDRWNYLTENMIDENIKSQFTYEKYEKDDLKGYKISSKKVSIDDVTKTEKQDRFYLSGNDSSTTDSQDALDTILKSPLFILDGKTYKSNMAYKVSDQISGSEDYFDLLDMKLVVTLPTKASSNNATKVSEDGKTLTWDLAKIKDENIDFEFAFSGSNMPFIIGGAAAAVVIVCVIVFAVLPKKKKGTPEAAPVEGTPVAPVETAPAAPVEASPVVETPVVETPVETTPVEPTPVVATPVEATPVEATPVEPAPVVDTTVVETPAEQTTDNTNVDNNQGM